MALLARAGRLGLILAAATFGLAEETALDRYVAAPDPAYRFQLVRSYPNIDHTLHVLEMVSQTWLTPAEVDQPEWRHWISIVAPRQVSSSTAMLFIGAGNNSDSAPLAVEERLLYIARNSRAVVAELRMVPNQPLTFKGDPGDRPRTEDALIAFAWDKYLRTGDSKWLPRLPMTKAAVRAMDTVAAFLKSEAGGGIAVDKFVVAGGSKRGWTAWTTAAVDKRVVAVVPLVVDLLHLEPSMIHHYRAYGRWAPALADYEQMGIMNWLGTPEMAAMLKIVEPYSYRERFTMPKLLINAAGDEFFLPDSSQFYFDDLPGEKRIYYTPNAGHSLERNEAFETLLSFFQAILKDAPLPRFSWTFPPDGGIVVTSQDKPSEVKLWHATNREARNFRRDAIGPAWRSSPVTAAQDGSYRAATPTPKQGWAAFYLELVFPSGGRIPFRFSTPVRVVPDTLPFPPPSRAGR
ncbi:MAG: PhoPQ-activated pathogenicity [Bryobacteraceae bacterium]|nr:PhoPQ-activated pathogenicity [Bryobacteraceae bacterium]